MHVRRALAAPKKNGAPSTPIFVGGGQSLKLPARKKQRQDHMKGEGRTSSRGSIGEQGGWGRQLSHLSRRRANLWLEAAGVRRIRPPSTGGHPRELKKGSNSPASHE